MAINIKDIKDIITGAELDRLTKQLKHLPGIIGGLGLSIAEAQKEFNKDYLNNIKRLLVMIRHTLGESKDENDEASMDAASIDAIRSLLTSLAPSRYQFTETTIEFRADLAESLDLALNLGIGFGYQAIMVNAGFTLGYGYDYRAAARITSVIHAMPADPAMTKSLLDRAGEITKNKLDLPEFHELDKEILKATVDARNAIAKKPVELPEELEPEKPEEPNSPTP